MERNPKLDPRVGDIVYNGNLTRTVTARRGYEIDYVDQNGNTRNCWITTWQNWCRKKVSGDVVVPPLTMNDYQTQAMRTNGNHSGITLSAEDSLLLNAALGLSGEAGEFCDLVKKYIFHGHPKDSVKLSKEAGDVQWYVAQAAKALNRLLGDIGQENLDKLAARYPQGFSTDASLNRSKDE